MTITPVCHPGPVAGRLSLRLRTDRRRIDTPAGHDASKPCARLVGHHHLMRLRLRLPAVHPYQASRSILQRLTTVDGGADAGSALQPGVQGGVAHAFSRSRGRQNALPHERRRGLVVFRHVRVGEQLPGHPDTCEPAPPRRHRSWRWTNRSPRVLLSIWVPWPKPRGRPALSPLLFQQDGRE